MYLLWALAVLAVWTYANRTTNLTRWRVARLVTYANIIIWWCRDVDAFSLLAACAMTWCFRDDIDWAVNIIGARWHGWRAKRLERRLARDRRRYSEHVARRWINQLRTARKDP